VGKRLSSRGLDLLDNFARIIFPGCKIYTHGRPFGREPQSNRSPDSAGGARHKSNLTIESLLHSAILPRTASSSAVAYFPKEDLFMRLALVVAVTALTCITLQADFSYTTTRKTTGGMVAQMANMGPYTSKIALRGQKMKIDNGSSIMVMDFDAQTLTTINPSAKTYTVQPFSQLSNDANEIEAKIDAKETGQKKTINGYNATEWVLTMDVDMPQARQMGPMRMEVDLWVSPDVPGASEQRAFYQRNIGKFPWAALAGGGGGRGMQQAMSDLQRKLASMNGVPVEQVVKIKSAGGGSAAGGAMPGMPAGGGMTPEQMQQVQGAMAQARARLEAMKAQGGPAAAIAEQQLARMGNTGGAPPAGANAAGASSGSFIEMTMDSSDFSTATVPDGSFAPPADYKKTN
jgi:hypothetical protein